MTTRDPNQGLIGQWTVDAERLREFVQQVRDRYRNSPFKPNDLLKACDARAEDGLQVVCRDDGVYVGTWRLSFTYNAVTAVRLREQWLEFEMEGGTYDIQVPIARNGRAEAERVAALYTRMGEESLRAAVAARQAPTWSNRLLDIVEGHFVLVMFGVFFVALPVVVLVIVLLGGGSD